MDGPRPTGLVGQVTGRASPLYLAVLAACRLVGRGAFGFRPTLLGRGLLPSDASGSPAGSWIAAGLPHRTWVDPFLVVDLLPRAPRMVFFGDGPTMVRSWWRRLAVRAIGGFIPIWPGGGRRQVEAHLEGARAALAAGAVLLVFPEVGDPAPPGSARSLGLGIAYLALRTGAPIVPLAIGGAEELYRGRQLVVRVLPPATWQELAGVDAGTLPPAPWSSDERRIAHRVVAALRERTAPDVAAVHRLARPPAGTVKRWTWLTTAWH
jgi:1-acyl-sn-glycerol-3-phosphate acyltransferase